MKAVVLEKRGKDGIRIGDFADPECPTGNAVIRVKAAALNHVDLYMRDSGKGITHELPMVLGLDAAGEIVEADPATGLKPGMAVMTYPMEFCGTCEYCQAGEQPFCSNLRIIGEQRHGIYGEYLSARAGCFLPIPDNLDWRQAAALPSAYMTAWRMVFGKSPLRAGETVLIHGIGGGVALAALNTVAARKTAENVDELNPIIAAGLVHVDPRVSKRALAVLPCPRRHGEAGTSQRMTGR